MAEQFAKFMICTKPWKVELTGTTLNVKVGDIVTIEKVNMGDLTAEVHFGGVLRKRIGSRELIEHTRIAEPDEFQKELKHCQRCDRIELESGRWMKKPPCFTPRAGVTIVPETCPDCD